MTTWQFVIIAVLLFLNLRATHGVRAQSAENTKSCNSIVQLLRDKDEA